MRARTAYLAELIGLYTILIPLTMFVNKATMVAAVTAFPQSPAAMVLAGVCALGVGLAIVLGHNVWSGGALPIVVTVVGWLSLLKGLVLLGLPPDSAAAYFVALQYAQYVYVYAAITLILGLYLTYGGFAAAKRANR